VGVGVTVGVAVGPGITVRVVLPLRLGFEVEVAVIVVMPTLTPEARPVLAIVATAVLLLAHVTSSGVKASFVP
jgi:hypothetical protein